MPSPFPGMDPFLENPVWFGGFHNKLITHIEEALQPILPAPYYANSGERVWLEASGRYVEPDVHVALSESSREQEAVREGPQVDSALDNVAVLVKVSLEERAEPYLEIRTRRGDTRKLVALIEVLSPANKTPGSDGMEQYLRKRCEVLESRAHLIEIDLLRGGQHVTAVPRDLALETGGPFDYHVSVHSFDRPDEYFVYPILLERALPSVTIPLLPGDPDVRLDLQKVLSRCYDLGPYGREIDYREDPIVPPLTDDQARRLGPVFDTLKRESARRKG